MKSAEQPAKPYLDTQFVYRVILVLALIAVGALVVILAKILLLLFGAVVVAVVLRSLADPLHQHAPLNAKGALAVTVLGLLGLTSPTIWLFGRETSQQVSELLETLPGRR